LSSFNLFKVNIYMIEREKLIYNIRDLFFGFLRFNQFISKDGVGSSRDWTEFLPHDGDSCELRSRQAVL